MKPQEHLYTFTGSLLIVQCHPLEETTETNKTLYLQLQHTFKKKGGVGGRGRNDYSGCSFFERSKPGNVKMFTMQCLPSVGAEVFSGILKEKRDRKLSHKSVNNQKLLLHLHFVPGNLLRLYL